MEIHNPLEKLETLGSRIETAEEVYVVAAYNHELGSKRYRMDKDFGTYGRQGVKVQDPRFYRSIVTTITNTIAVTEDEWWESHPLSDEPDPDIPPF